MMTFERSTDHESSRRGAAAVEFAMLLPFLMLLVVVAIDFSRLYYHYTTITNCARNGAIYASDDVFAAEPPYYKVGDRKQSITNAALVDASNLSPTPRVTVLEDSSSRVAVKVEYEFSYVTGYFGTKPLKISRTVILNKAPTTPNPN